MHEEDRPDTVGGDHSPDCGDCGGVQPPDPLSTTYRGPYGEPVVVPVTDDPEGHPDYQPGYGEADLPDLDVHRNRSDHDAKIEDSFAYGIRYHFDRNLRPVIDSFNLVSDPGNSRTDHGAS
jgi:hypothetical protein